MRDLPIIYAWPKSTGIYTRSGYGIEIYSTQLCKPIADEKTNLIKYLHINHIKHVNYSTCKIYIIYSIFHGFSITTSKVGK